MVTGNQEKHTHLNNRQSAVFVHGAAVSDVDLRNMLKQVVAATKNHQVGAKSAL